MRHHRHLKASIGFVGLCVLLLGQDARADDPPPANPEQTAAITLTQLGVTISVPAQAGFVQHVEEGRDVITAPAPFDRVTLGFAMLAGQRGPCGLIGGLPGATTPLASREVPAGWTQGARFRRDALEADVLCVDLPAGQLNALIIRTSSDDAVDLPPYGAVLSAVRAAYGEALPPPATEPVVTPTPTPAPTPEPTPTPVPDVAKESPPPEEPKHTSRPMLGYRVWEGSFYDIGYGREVAPWVSPDGKTAVTLGGLRFFEHRGTTINLLLMVLTLGASAGTPMSAVTTDASGRQWVNAAAEARAHEEYNKNLIEGAAHKPISLEILGYHDSMGSEMDGLSFALSVTSEMGDRGAKQYGLAGGHLASNRNYVPSTADAPMEFTRSWLGATYDYRRRLYQTEHLVAGIHGHAMLALGDPWIALITIGPELAITDRVQLSAYASQDLKRFDLSNGMGWRAELGVRF